MRHVLLALGILGVAVSSAIAEETSVIWFPERVHSVHVGVADQVTDGCWPRPHSTREAVELQFRSAGIPITEENSDEYLEYRHHAFLISTVGYATDTYNCAVSLGITVLRRETLQHYPYPGVVLYGLDGALFTGPKTSMQSRITEAATEYATRMANAILRARGQ